MYKDNSIEYLKKKARRIGNTSQSPNEVRRKIVKKLEYPYSEEGIAVRMNNAGCMIMFWGPNGEIINV